MSCGYISLDGHFLGFQLFITILKAFTLSIFFNLSGKVFQILGTQEWNAFSFMIHGIHIRYGKLQIMSQIILMFIPFFVLLRFNWRRQAFAILIHLKSKKLKIYIVNRERAIIFPAVPQMMMTHQNKLELVVNLLVCVVYLFLYGEHECDVSIQDSSSWIVIF